MSGDRNVDFVLRTVEERDIRFIRLWFTDVLGNLKSFSISAEDLEEAFEEGIGFDGSSVQGFVPQCESDMLAFPDPTTFQVLPWRPEERGRRARFLRYPHPVARAVRRRPPLLPAARIPQGRRVRLCHERGPQA